MAAALFGDEQTGHLPRETTPIDGAVLALPYREAGYLYRNNGRRWGSHRPEPTIVTAVLSSTIEPA